MSKFQWKNWNLLCKFSLGFGVIFLLFFISLYINYKGNTTLTTEYSSLVDNEFEISILSNEIENLMLQCRRNEKDFLLRKDLKYVVKHKANIQEIRNKIENLQKRGNEQGITKLTTIAKDIAKNVDDYEEGFLALVSAWQDKGLNSKLGFQGEFRKTVHDLEDILKNHELDSLYLNLLQIRRYEKDFQRTRNLKYEKKWSKSIESYAELLDSSILYSTTMKEQKRAISSYKKAQIEFLNSTDEKSSNEIYNKIISDAHELESSLKGVYIYNVSSLLLQIRRSEKDYLLRGSEKYVKKTKSKLDALRLAVENSTAKTQYKKSISEGLVKYWASFSKLVNEDIVIKGDISLMRDAIHKVGPLTTKLHKMALSKVASVNVLNQNHAKKIRYNSITLSSIAGGIGILFAFLITSYITGSINEISRAMNSIAAGDLNLKLKQKGSDECAQLKGSVNHMVEGLTKLVEDMIGCRSDINGSSDQLKNVSKALMSNSETSLMQTEELASASDQISVSINTMASSAEELSVNIASVSSGAVQMSTNMGQVSKAINNVSQSVTEIVDNVEISTEVADKGYSISVEASTAVVELDKSATEIGEITEMIKRIADQTNLLALNATIEAASAGDAGKGFAVVAGEIKELAKQSSDAADKISNSIEGIQSSTDNTVRSFNDLSEIIKNISKSISGIKGSVENHNNAMDQISQNVVESSRGSDDIARSISEASVASSDMSKNISEVADSSKFVNKNLLSVNDLVKKGTECAHAVDKNSDEMNKLSMNLGLLVSQFKIDKQSDKTVNQVTTNEIPVSYPLEDGLKAV